MLGPAYHFDLVRPGYALYGGQASQSKSAPVKPAVTVAARILAVCDVLPGESVGYSATWRARRASRIATIAAGYADGIPRSASGPGEPTSHGGMAANGGGAGRHVSGGHVMIDRTLAPIVGRVSMDLITVDVTDVPAGSAKPGDFVKLIGNGISIEDAGFAANTIGYEILTRLGPRFQRLSLGDGG